MYGLNKFSPPLLSLSRSSLLWAEEISGNNSTHSEIKLMLKKKKPKKTFGFEKVLKNDVSRAIITPKWLNKQSSPLHWLWLASASLAGFDGKGLFFCKVVIICLPSFACWLGHLSLFASPELCYAGQTSVSNLAASQLLSSAFLWLFILRHHFAL